MLLPPEALIVYTRGRLPESNEDYRSRRNPIIADTSLVVLVNKYSASASEILAGAIQDNGRGIIMGDTTFGKASVQTIYPLAHSEGEVAGGKDKERAALRLTTAKYFTPNGQEIHERLASGISSVDVSMLPKRLLPCLLPRLGSCPTP